MSNEDQKTGIVIPREKLSNTVLDALIDEFILREGTDYGTAEYSLEQKKKQVFRQLDSKHILILFDPKLETTNLLTIDQVKKLSQQNFEIVGLPEGL